jgi:hypothetical protein
MSEFVLPDELPAAFLEEAERQAGDRVPGRLSEPGITGSPVTASEIDAVVDEVRSVIFPYHGLG